MYHFYFHFANLICGKAAVDGYFISPRYIWDSEVGEITETLKENGITEFTISSTFSSLIPTLAEFAKHGFQMAGLTEVKANYTDLQTQERAVIPAIRMAAEEA